MGIGDGGKLELQLQAGAPHDGCLEQSNNGHMCPAQYLSLQDEKGRAENSGSR